MDLGRQIYLSNKKNFGSKMIFEQQKQKYLPEFFSSEKNYFLKTNLKKIFEKKFSTSSNSHPVQISSHSDYCITLS